MLSHRIAQRLLAISQLHPGLSRGSKNQIGMAEGMIRDHVPSPHQFERDIRPLPHKAPDDEKCCLHILPGKNLQQTQSVRVVGTIVVSQRQLLGSTLDPSKRSPKPLPRRRLGLIAHSNRRYSNTSPQGEATHDAAIVNCFSVPLGLCGENGGYYSLNCAQSSAGISCHAKP